MARHGQVQHSRRVVAGAAILIATLLLPSTAFQPVGAAVPGEFTLTVSLAGSASTSGNVTSDPVGIECGPDCSEAYPDGSIVSLTATLVGPDAANATFAGWSGDADCADGAVTMTADRTCIATFDVVSAAPIRRPAPAPSASRRTREASRVLAAVAEDTLPTAGKPSDVTFPFGFFSWTVDGLTPGPADHA